MHDTCAAHAGVTKRTTYLSTLSPHRWYKQTPIPTLHPPYKWRQEVTYLSNLPSVLSPSNSTFGRSVILFRPLQDLTLVLQTFHSLTQSCSVLYIVSIFLTALYGPSLGNEPEAVP